MSQPALSSSMEPGARPVLRRTLFPTDGPGAWRPRTRYWWSAGPRCTARWWTWSAPPCPTWWWWPPTAARAWRTSPGAGGV